MAGVSPGYMLLTHLTRSEQFKNLQRVSKLVHLDEDSDLAEPLSASAAPATLCRESLRLAGKFFFVSATLSCCDTGLCPPGGEPQNRNLR